MLGLIVAGLQLQEIFQVLCRDFFSLSVEAKLRENCYWARYLNWYQVHQATEATSNKVHGVLVSILSIANVRILDMTLAPLPWRFMHIDKR